MVQIRGERHFMSLYILTKIKKKIFKSFKKSNNMRVVSNYQKRNSKDLKTNKG